MSSIVPNPGVPVTVINDIITGDNSTVIVSNVVGLPVTYVPAQEPNWQRPADWLKIPAIGASENKFIGLYAVTDDNSNYLALSATGNYTVNWGDGSVESVASGVQANHLFSYASIPASTLSTRGYRQVLVTVTPQAGQSLTNINLQKKHTAAGLSTYNATWLDISLNSPSLLSLVIVVGNVVRLNWMESARLDAIGTVTSFASLFSSNCQALRSVTITGSSAVTDFTSMFSGCLSLQTVPLFNTSAGVTFTSMFSSCSALQTVPLFNTASGVTFTSMFNGCSALQTVPLFNTASGVTFTSMFNSCSTLQTVPLFNTVSGVTFTSMFNSCRALQTVPLFNTASGVTFTTMFSNCAVLQTVPLFNTVSGVTFTSMLSGCAVLQTVPLFNTASGVTFNSMFNGCSALQTIPLFNTASGTAFTSMFNGCTSLATGVMAGTTRTISYSGTKLSHAAIVAVFNSIGTAAGAQTVTVSTTPGFAALTASDLSIATDKGWTVA